MEKLNILLVEDNPLEALEMEVFAQNAGMTVVGIARSGEQALQLLAEKQPDLVVFDIHLEGELDGIETAQIAKRSLNIPILFLTEDTRTETMRRAARAQAENYLPKPFTERNFLTAIRFALLRFAEEVNHTPAWFALNDSFFLADEDGYRKIKKEEVFFLKASKEKTIFYLANNQRLTCSMRLGELEAKMQHMDFLRVHRSFMINPKNVEGIRKGMLIFPDGLTTSFSAQYLPNPALVFPILGH